MCSWDDLYLLMRMYRFKFSIGPGRPERALEEHRRILEAIEQRDADLAELLMRRHIGAARVRLEAETDNPTETDTLQEEPS